MLVAQLSRGDLAAFEALYERYAREVFVMAAHALGRRDAEEVVQDVFLRLWERARQFDPERGSFPAWFMTIARHRVFDELKRRGTAVAFSAEVDDLLAAAPDPAGGLDEQAVLTERRDAVHAAVRQLPEEQRRAVVLAYFGGLSQSAIAEELGVPLGTVKKRIKLAVDKLRESLSGSSSVQDRERSATSRQGT
jgi:RNA polymerase sigma-70 factor, ECF subfamily